MEIKIKKIASYQKFRPMPDGKGRVFSGTCISVDLEDGKTIRFRYDFIPANLRGLVKAVVEHVYLKAAIPAGVSTLHVSV